MKTLQSHTSNVTRYPILITLAVLAIIGGLLVSNKNTTNLTSLNPTLATGEAGFNDIVINARGTNGKEKIALFINNAPVQFWNLRNNFQDYTYTPNGEITVSELSIHFLNDTWEPENNINYDVQIPYITVNGTKYNSEHSSTVSTGSWDQDNWCAPGNKQTQWLNCTGSFKYNIPQGTVVGLPVGDPKIVPLTFPATDMTLTTPMNANGTFIASPIENQGSAATLIEIPETGDYTISFRVRAPSNANDAFYFTLGDADRIRTFPPFLDQTDWYTYAETFALQKGQTRLLIETIEPNLQMYEIALEKREPVDPGDGTNPEGEVIFGGFTQNDLPNKFRPLFGCGGTIEDDWINIATSWNKTWNVSSRTAFDNAVRSMSNGDRILIENGTNLGTVELTSSGNPTAKKYIMGRSSCGDVNGADTFSTRTRFIVSGNDWVFMNLKMDEDIDGGRSFEISGARNWIYNNRIGMGGEVLLDPRYSSDTSGNRIISNYFDGATNNAGVRMLNPFMTKDAKSVIDLVIGGNTFTGFVEASYASKTITDATWGWNYPYGSATDIPGAETFTELGWNHFIDSHGEIPTSKTSRWMIHNNLYEQTASYRGQDPPHISLRGGDDKLIFRNILLDGSSRVAQKGLRLSGARSQGYYNVIYRTGNRGIDFTWTSIEENSNFPTPDNTFLVYERLQDIDWRYNFLLGDGDDVSSWLKFGTIGSRSIASLPPTRNTVKDNFYSATNPDRIVMAIDDDRLGLKESDWNDHNPNATASLQHFATRSGDRSTLKSDVAIPTSVTVKDFWLNGENVRVNLPPWISSNGDGLIDLTR